MSPLASPLKTLTGRMVLVTMAAVALSYAAAFVLYANERGAALRRAAETSMIERVAFVAERLREAPPERRAQSIRQTRDFAIRYQLAGAPGIEAGAGGRAQRIARALAERLNGADVRASTRTVERPVGRWREHMERRMRAHEGELENFAIARAPAASRAPPRMTAITEVTLSMRLDETTWLNARAHLPGPRPAPLGVLAGGLLSVIAVGAGAALVARQIGAPLAELAGAARAFGAGETAVRAPVSGPQDVRRASSAFNAMAERLGRQLERQRQMLWALSHDLRTPITALRLRAELVDDEATRQRLLGPLAEMERLTEQALALARAGASEEARARVDLADIARTLCGELQDMGVPAQAAGGEPVMALCRPSEIARALRNLAENAAKHGGGGVMRAYRGPGGEAIVEVTDEGPGVPADLLARLTQPFFRAEAARTSGDEVRQNGDGLGLAIAQAIAEGHGGRLVLANKSPRGFSARLVLPAPA